MIDRKGWRAKRAEDNNFIVEDTEEDAGDDYEVSEDGVNIAEISEGEDEEICEVGENYEDEEIEEQEIEDLIENASSAFPGIWEDDVEKESVVVMEEEGEGKSWFDGEKETSMEIFELQEKENDLKIKDELFEKPRRSFEKSVPVIQISIQHSDEKNVSSSKEAEKVESFPETINNLGKKDASRLKKETVDYGERIVGPGKESTTFENKSESYEEKRISFENKGTFVDGNEYLEEVRTGNYFPSEMFKRENTRFTGNKSLDDEDEKLLEKKKKLPWKQRRLRIRELKKNREIKMEILKNRLNTLKRRVYKFEVKERLRFVRKVKSREK